ncbi:hypothetical protein BDK89_3549 [Ilumatobacter fluminis]|uniref:Uncharacterized protein n=1 Tax=Ilumatobacter fluminis TaxID=467091 RepID=A0A4R7I5A4_9ACTN|nr:hypothetical protein [Ilumatobacter fluminis]TDT17936.1 hypothetical protein BDK89_3549 [Ilumatobacter fluminis]
MQNPGPTPLPVYELACLAHTIPGISFRIVAPTGESLLVSASCLAADLDPCRLRTALTSSQSGPRLAVTAERAELVSGAVHVGGGLYQRSHPQAAGERWFVVTTPADRLLDVIADVRLDGPAADEVAVTIGPDDGLGLCAVRVRAESDAACARIDDLAFAVLATCVVDEFLHDVAVDVPEQR